MSVGHKRAARGIGPSLAAAAVWILVIAGSAFGAQLVPPGGPNAIGTCANTSASPCTEWPKTSSNLSVTLYLLNGHFLADEEVNLFTDSYNAQFVYNDIAARNPHLEQTTNSAIDDVTVTTVDFGDFQVYGSTTNSYPLTAPYNITKSVIKLNRQIKWNRSLNFACTATVCNADARKVMNHEYGHMEGLAHRPSTVTAIMRQGALTFYQVQAEDRASIVSIYGAYP